MTMAKAPNPTGAAGARAPIVMMGPLPPPVGVIELIHAGADINACDPSDQMTPLMLSAKQVQYQLECGRLTAGRERPGSFVVASA